MTPNISVVIPAYKAASYLGATLDSVLAQTRTDWECIIVDDGSPDESAAVAQSYAARDPRFQLIRQANAGVAAARNTGYARTSPQADYVIFLDSDDLWLPDTLETLTAALDAHPEAVGAHGLTHSVGADGALQNDFFVRFGRERYGFEAGRVVPLTPDQPTTFAALVMRFTVYPPALALVRRSVLEQVGPWESSLAPSEDWDMLVRLGRHGPLIFVDKVVALYRRHGGNATTTNRGHWGGQAAHPAPPGLRPGGDAGTEADALPCLPCLESILPRPPPAGRLVRPLPSPLEGRRRGFRLGGDDAVRAGRQRPRPVAPCPAPPPPGAAPCRLALLMTARNLPCCYAP